MCNVELLVQNNVLMAMVPPVGYRSEWGYFLAFLKLSEGMTLTIQASELDFLDGDGHLLERQHNAFGLTPGMHLCGPYSAKLGDDRRHPATASLAKWHLNHLQVETSLQSPLAPLKVLYLPLQVPLSQDDHIVVSLVTLGETLLNMASAIQEAVCWADGVAYASIAGRVWNGSYLLRPNHGTTRRFRLSDFPGIPRYGTHEMRLEIAGICSPPQTVTWCGEPFLDAVAVD